MRWAKYVAFMGALLNVCIILGVMCKRKKPLGIYKGR
jgi:hypothetical protein